MRRDDGILKADAALCGAARSVRMISMYEVALALGLLSAAIIVVAHVIEAFAPDRKRPKRHDPLT
jgi:hypothetical protein